MLLAGEVLPAVPEGLDALLPPWAQQLSLVSLLVVTITALLRGWVVPRSQNERDVAAERRIAEIWESNATQSMELNKQLTEALSPVLEGNEAILRAVQALQAEQDRLRYRRDRP